jgi:hypothetical protein
MLNQSAAPARLIAKRFAPISDNSPEPQKLSLNERIAALPWRGTKRGEKIMLSLSEAATAAGIAKSTIWRAVKSGRVSATRTALGTYQVDPAELFRVFPAMPKNVEMKQPAPAMETGLIPALEAQISALKEVGSLLKEQLEDTRKDRDAWRTQAESNQHLLIDARPRRRGLFGWRKA